MAKRRTTRRKKASKRSQKTYIRLKPKAKKKLAQHAWVLQLAIILGFVYLLYGGIVHFWNSSGSTAIKEKLPVIEKVVQKVSPIVKPQPKVTPPAAPKKAYSPPRKTLRRPRPVPIETPKLVFVIDDMGQNEKTVPHLKQLGDAITYAILPKLRSSKAISRLSRQTKADVILHQPLEAKDGTIPGPGLITSRMTKEHIQEILKKNFSMVPEHMGMNNHMGSRGTGNYHLMRVILNDVKARGLFFLDSMTTPTSVTRRIAAGLRIPYIRRDIFLDNVDDKEAVRDQIWKAAEVANRQGHAVAIGHDRASTLQALIEEIPRLKANGFAVVSLYDLVSYLDSNK